MPVLLASVIAGSLGLIGFGLMTGRKFVLGFYNGAPFPMMVKTIGNGQFARSDVADAFLEMVEAARQAGITLIANSGFRSMGEQVDLWTRRYVLHTFNCGVPADQPCSVAVPGTSNHQGGVAIDIGPQVTRDSAAFAWLTQNAGQFGFSWDEGQRAQEPWHWRYVGRG